MKYEIINATDRTAWDAFVTAHPEANFLHSWDWGEFHLARGKQIVRRIVVTDSMMSQDTSSLPRRLSSCEGDSQAHASETKMMYPATSSNLQIIAAYTGVVETAKRGTHLAIAGGPIMDWSNRPLVTAVFADIAAAGRAHRCAFVRIRPQLEKSEASLALFRSLGLKPAPMYLSVEHAGILDLRQSEEEILAGMRQRLRRALRKAEKAGITVETSTDPARIQEFYQIQLETAKRHGFIEFSESFLTKQFTAFASHGEAVLYIAKYQGQILAENFMIFYGHEASYHYGVSTELGTQLSGAPLLHMQAMRDARSRGIDRYNFWGIVDEDATTHRFYGVSTFKRGFGVTELRYTPAHDIILNPALYTLTKLIETARRKHRHV